MKKKYKQKQTREERIASQLAKLNSSNKKDRERAKKYLRKNQRLEPVPFFTNKFELDSYKAQLEPLVSEANRRIELIKSRGYTSYAIDRVEHEGGSEYFSLDDVNTRDELLREITRLRVFINDKGSTLEGAQLQTAQIYGAEYKGKFGNQYHNLENHFKNFDIKTIDEDVAKRAFANYRRIEEHRAAEIVSDGAYGSENLIVALYDAEIRGMDSLEYGEDLLDTYQKMQTEEWERATFEANSITSISGKIEDTIRGGYQF